MILPKVEIVPVTQSDTKKERKKYFLQAISSAMSFCFPKNEKIDEKTNWLPMYGIPSKKGNGEYNEPPIYDKYHIDYLSDYFSDDENCAVLTMIVEQEYFSPTFFNDYKNFYSSIFTRHDRTCSRIHFLGCEFSNADLREFLNIGQNDSLSLSILQDKYLGFLVLRPLPEQIIGPTLLKLYPKESKDGKYLRTFHAAREYSVNLFGINIPVNSLIFTSQDKIVGACASYALWMAFHKTSELFKTQLPTPSEITRKAGKSTKTHHKTFPNKGLDAIQIGTAIESIGLEPEYRAPEKGVLQLYYHKIDRKFFNLAQRKRNYEAEASKFDANNWLTVLDIISVKAYIYAYSKAGIPVLLGIRFSDSDLHLIAISGYKELSAISPLPNDTAHSESLSLTSNRITNFYCHDDNVGAFSRLSFCDDIAKIGSEGYDYGKLITGWSNPKNE